MTDEDVAWVILVCGFMGSLIGLLMRTGATSAFTAKLAEFGTRRESGASRPAGEGVTIPKEWIGVWDTDGYTKIWVIYSEDGSGL